MGHFYSIGILFDTASHDHLKGLNTTHTKRHGPLLGYTAGCFKLRRICNSKYSQTNNYRITIPFTEMLVNLDESTLSLVVSGDLGLANSQ